MKALTAAAYALLLAARPLYSQSLSEPAKVIQIVRNNNVPGRDAANEKVAVQYVQISAKANLPGFSLALMPEAAPDPWQVWYLNGYNSFAEIEEYEKKIEQSPAVARAFGKLETALFQMVTTSETMIASYHPEWSYRAAESAKSLPKTRYAAFTLWHIRPGYEEEFAGAIRAQVGAMETAKREQPMLVYEVVAGMHDRMYLLMETMTAAGVLDRESDRERVLRQAMGEPGWQSLQKTLKEITIGTERWLFSVDVPASYVSRDFAAADPEFWKTAAKR